MLGPMERENRMLKELKLTQAHIDYVRHALSLIEGDYHDEFCLRKEYDNADEAYADLIGRDFVETSHEIVDGSRSDIASFVRINMFDRVDALKETSYSLYWSRKRTNCNEYCPDGSKRIEGYTHRLELDGYRCDVLKWRDYDEPKELLIDVLFDRKILFQRFEQKLTKHVVFLYSYVNDKGKLRLLKYRYSVPMNDFPRSLLREDERCSLVSRLRDFNKRLTDWDGSTSSSLESDDIEKAAIALDATLNDISNNIMGGFAIRAFDAEIAHGENSLDVAREREIARKVIASLSRPSYDSDAWKECKQKAIELCQSRKQELIN